MSYSLLSTMHWKPSQNVSEKSIGEGRKKVKAIVHSHLSPLGVLTVNVCKAGFFYLPLLLSCFSPPFSPPTFTASPPSLPHLEDSKWHDIKGNPQWEMDWEQMQKASQQNGG